MKGGEAELYRGLVVADHSAQSDSHYLERLGFKNNYNPERQSGILKYVFKEVK